VQVTGQLHALASLTPEGIACLGGWAVLEAGLKAVEVASRLEVVEQYIEWKMALIARGGAIY
jgi:hypothetical protein